MMIGEINWKTLVEWVRPADILQLKKVFDPRVDFKGVSKLRILTTRLGSTVDFDNKFNCSPEDGYVFESYPMPREKKGEKFDVNNPKYQPDWVEISDKSKDVRCQYKQDNIYTPFSNYQYECTHDDSDEITTYNHSHTNWGLRIMPGQLPSVNGWNEEMPACVIPAIYIKLDSFIKLMEVSKTFEIFPDVKDKGCFPSIIFGMYPKAIKEDKCFEIYSKIYNKDASVKYLGKESGFKFPHFVSSEYYNLDERPYWCGRFYEYKSKALDKYEVDGQIVFSDKSNQKHTITHIPQYTTPQYMIMRIANWEQLPKSINPNGDGSAKHLIVIPNELIFNNVNNFVSWKHYDEVCKFLNNEFLDAAFNINIPFTIERRTLIEEMINSYNRATPFESTRVIDGMNDKINDRINKVLEELNGLGARITLAEKMLWYLESKEWITEEAFYRPLDSDYAKVCEKLGVEPPEKFFVDDDSIHI